MSPLRALARPLLASAFILDGVDALRHADEHAEKARPFAPTLAKVGEKVPGLPTDPKALTRLVGAVQVAAGVLLATGKAPRVAAATLAVITVPTTIVRHPAWSTKGTERQEHVAGLLRSAALLGGLIFAAEDREGKPSIGWRYENWREHRDELTQLRDELKAEVKAAKQDA
ncbi:DoxX family protein [Pseudactinotalea sp.]|uniref:DoxX family protein n=1 Tax=Pseudactinotalea sp. TaxID=1926260 RepID=UPI003B3A5E52